MLIDLKDILKNMLNTTWPIIVISMVVIISLRITDILIKKEKIVLYKEILKLAFVLYILCLFQIVSKEDVSYGGINILPFKEMFRYDVGTYLFYKNILGNLLLFMPYGFFIGYFLNINKSYIIFILSIIASASIEITQLYIGRVFDVDDIILNVIGALFGFAIYRLIYKFNNKIPEKYRKNWLLDIIIVIIIILVVRFIVLWKSLIFIMRRMKI